MVTETLVTKEIAMPDAPIAGIFPRRTPVPEFDFVMFGATGDLAARKLLPALLQRENEGVLPPEGRIICTGHRELSTEDYIKLVLRNPPKDVPADKVARFIERLQYVTVEATDPASYGALAAILTDPEKVRVFYLATAPRLFASISTSLAAAGLITPETRVVLEKPIGHDLASSREINDAVGRVFAEKQIYRIDHYLGKETVQNLMVLRFANPLFERPWTSADIDNVQITCAETIGVEGRGGYYDQSGALRDMVQNHIMQLLCLIAMEPPTKLDENSVRDEKLKVLQALRPIRDGDVKTKTVRGQYGAGAVNGAAVHGYLKDIELPASNTETFVAIKAEIGNWRWAGVPFYLRTGKRMPKQCSEIVITFKNLRHSIFPPSVGVIAPNRLVIRLQPDDGVTQITTMKAPGSGQMALIPASLQLNFKDGNDWRVHDAYERLITDVIRGDPTLFMRRDEVEASWRWIEPIHAGWAEQTIRPIHYSAGTWGPSAAIALMERDGRSWFEDGLLAGV